MNNRVINFILLSLAGKIIGDLTSKKSVKINNNAKNLPSFKGVLEVKHSLTGRIRFFIPLLHNNEDVKSLLVGQLSRVPAIKTIEANIITGNLLLVFDEKEVEPTILIGVIIKLLGLEEKANKKPEAILTSEMKNMKEALNMAIYEKTNGILDGKSLMVILSLFGGFKMLKANPTALPNGYTLLRWAEKEL
ncbi:MAG: HMA2 domain-containing protein [Sarcina sp.]